MLREYLVRERESQILIDRVMLLWASTQSAGTADAGAAEVHHRMKRSASSRRTEASACPRSSERGSGSDNTPLETKSDGYATGVVAFALQQAGVTRDQPQLKRALAGSTHNQDKTDGRWLAYSLNKQRDLSTDIGRFMSDAATAYAVLALNPSN